MPAQCSRRTFLATSALFVSAFGAGCTTSSQGGTETTTVDDCERDTVSTPSEPVETSGAIVQNDDASEHAVSLQLFVFESSRLSAEETREVSADRMPCRSVKVSERELDLDPDAETTIDSLVPVYDEQTKYWLTVTIDGEASSAFVFEVSEGTELGYLAINVESPTEASLRLAVR